jgi:hypothetical protein
VPLQDDLSRHCWQRLVPGRYSKLVKDDDLAPLLGGMPATLRLVGLSLLRLCN